MLVPLLSATCPGLVHAQERQTLTFQDLMKVRQIRSPSISADGHWVALAAVPDRGDGEALVYSADGGVRHALPRGSNPVISADGLWVAARLDPSFEDRETAGRGEAPRPGLTLLQTGSGETREWEEIQRFGFSSDGKWLARLGYPPREGQDEESEGLAGEAEAAVTERVREEAGTLMVLRELGSGLEVEIPNVTSFTFQPDGPRMAYVVAAPDGQGDGVYLRELREGAGGRGLEVGEFLQVQTLAWWEEGPRLAWVWAHEDEDGEAGPGSLAFWNGTDVREVDLGAALPSGWELPARNSLDWSEDGDRLFYGARPAPQEEAGEPDEEGDEEPFDPYDLETILEGRAVDVWHTEDPLINPNQKQVWSRQQTRTYVGVYHLTARKGVQLGDTLVQLQGIPENPLRALASSSVPYLKESTWTGGAEDIFLVDLETGERTEVVERFGSESSAANSWIGVRAPSLSLSPGGRFLVWFMDDHWHLYDAETGGTRNLTEGLDVPFYDVDHDYPNPRGGHGIGGWIEGDEAVLIHDKFDVWRFPTDGSRPVNLTEGRGRREELILRVLRMDPDADAFGSNDWVHLASFDWADKSFGFFRTRARSGGMEPLLDEEKRFSLVAKAEDADRLLYTREDYDEFPDLWVSSADFSDGRKVTDVNPGLLERFAWGSSRLVEWTSDDGIPLQGVVILPGNYEEGKRYPVLTYFYRFMSERLHAFNQPVINHRPSFPIYASDGYIVFLPDVRFQVGRPGLSAMKSVVPGVKKLVDLGLADPGALGLHGHSWSGYTTAFIVTQTNIFAAAVAGAPVSNMTSAYGGIRWGSGLARQFQYEQTQSRLSGSLWEAPLDYIQNSPLFFADKVETPLVLMHGDEDDAVPWYQSIELYLALRRLGKEAVFLQYRGEPHHPQEYGNKLDYSIRMKEFFDHYLKGAPAPEWWAKGQPYNGR
jgi:hypothetical protein